MEWSYKNYLIKQTPEGKFSIAGLYSFDSSIIIEEKTLKEAEKTIDFFIHMHEEEKEKETAHKVIFSFGKHKGEKIYDVIEKDPQYVQWCKENVKGFLLTKTLEEHLEMFCFFNGVKNWLNERIEEKKKAEAKKPKFGPNDIEEAWEYYNSLNVREQNKVIWDFPSNVRDEINNRNEYYHHNVELSLENGETIVVPRSAIEPDYDCY